MKLSPLPTRRPRDDSAHLVTVDTVDTTVTVDLRPAESAPQPAPLDEVLGWLQSLES